MVRCITCGKEFDGLAAIHGHARIHDGAARYACVFCGGRVERYDKNWVVIKRTIDPSHQKLAVYARCTKERVWWGMEEFGRLTVRVK